MAQLVKCLSYKHEDLNSDLQHIHEKLDIKTWNPNNGETETGSFPEITGHPVSPVNEH